MYNTFFNIYIYFKNNIVVKIIYYYYGINEYQLKLCKNIEIK